MRYNPSVENEMWAEYKQFSKNKSPYISTEVCSSCHGEGYHDLVIEDIGPEFFVCYACYGKGFVVNHYYPVNQVIN